MKLFERLFKHITLAFLLCFFAPSTASSPNNEPTLQADSIEISLLTCGPRQQVYSLYGHTAIRFQDKQTGRDIAINYGVFSFDQPFFVLRFVFGLTDYEMGIAPFDIFEWEYGPTGCGVRQQVLNLTAQEKMAIAQAVDRNMEPQNRVYRYNFFYDNCTTRARDIIANNLNGRIVYDTSTPQHLNTSYLNTSTPQHLTTTPPRGGVVVMNCNPFTLGHRYLIEQAAKQVKRLYVMVVREDCSLFAYTERKAMVEQGVADIKNVTVIDGSDYAISRATFPTYFLKRLDDAADTQMLLDLDLFRRHIAPALGATVRFVGTEPTDQLTRRYNQLMHEALKDVREIDRLEKDGYAVSASRVRKAMEQGDMNTIRQLVPPTTLPYIIAHLATQALQAELDTTPKPGLVDKDNNGAHRDMDHALMQLSINTLHPYFVRLALLGFADTLPSHTSIRDAGIEAEKAMLEATNGVNTHKGALFSMGLAVVAAAYEEKKTAANKEERGKEREEGYLSSLQLTIKALAASFPDTSGTHGSKAKQLSNGTTTIKGALDNAREGYEKLFAEWLPFYNERRKSHDAHALHKTLLRIMCDLDDTNVIYRTNVATAEEVKQEARALLASFEEAYAAEDKEKCESAIEEKCASAIEEKCASAELLALKDMDRRYTERNISPGGAADMLSLTVFIGSIQTY